MTNCTPNLMSMSPLNGKKIQVSFSGGSITSESGLLLIREVDRNIGLTKKISAIIKDTRHQSYIHHNLADLIRQRVYAIVAGYEDVNDHDQLCHDPGFQISVGRDVKLASSSTLSRFENSIDKGSMIEINKLFVEQFINSHAVPPKQLTLDFDPTDFIIYGNQEKRHFHGYYGDFCFLPLYVFCNGRLLVSLLRPSNIDGSKHSGAILKLLVKRFREVWPKVKIIFRGDSGFSRNLILNWCDRNGVKYVVGMSSNNRLRSMGAAIALEAKLQYQSTKDTQELFDSFNYATIRTWREKRRIIVKAKHSSENNKLFFLVTNLDHEAEVVYKEWYNPRGDMENSIKQQLDLFADRMSCHDFYANQFRMLLSSMAYILMFELQEKSLINTTLSKAYMHTLRLKLIKIGGVILKNTRKIQFLLPTHYPYQDEFKMAVESLVPK